MKNESVYNMKGVTRRILIAISVIFSVFGILFGLNGAVTNNYTILIISVLSVIIGIILFAVVFE